MHAPPLNSGSSPPIRDPKVQFHRIAFSNNSLQTNRINAHYSVDVPSGDGVPFLRRTNPGKENLLFFFSLMAGVGSS